jgi:two-component system, LytTR family, sensor kinase
MKISLDKKRIKVYLWIAAAYTALWIFSDIINNPETLLPRIWNYIWLNSFLLFFNFIFFEYTLPLIKLTWKRLLIAPFLIWAHVMINTFGLYAWRNIGINLHLYFELRVFSNVFEGVENIAAIGIFSLFFYGIVKHIYDYRKLKQSAQLLVIEKQAAELNFLKSQTNPHFLFNTLNNIYSLARDKSELAPESILRLSKILRYILYETGGKYIAIEQELKIINDYISLEKLRYDESLRINFNYDVEDMKQSLPPLLLMPLVENAFKHGASETRHNPYIDIHLSVKNRKLELTVKNSTEHSQRNDKVTESIGLSNLRRQLELLYKDYELTIRNDEKLFTAILKINLAGYV